MVVLKENFFWMKFFSERIIECIYVYSNMNNLYL